MTKPKDKRNPEAKKGSKEGSFDCIAFKRRAQSQIHRKIKGMTPEEELAHWNRPADGPLKDWWRSIQEHSAAVRERPEDSP